MKLTSYITNGGIRVTREIRNQDYQPADTALARALDERRGVLFSSSFEFPGRYTRWDMGFVDPPLVFTARGRRFTIDALNERGQVLLDPVAESLAGLAANRVERVGRDRISGEIEQTEQRFPEESRSRQPSVFSVLRTVVDLFGSAEDQHLGLYGAFGYDLVFQFEPMQLRLPRPEDQRDLVLYLPDEILVVDHMRQISETHRYEFEAAGLSTSGLQRSTAPASYRIDHAPATRPIDSDHGPGEYAALVERAKAAFVRGDLFEVVCGQLLADACTDAPSVVFHRLRQANPAPYGALINLGEGEFLVSASPEMYVRVDGRRIETCPISGTIARGRDPVEDAARIRELLNSAKDESELTMCTDVDRNDKSRVCLPGTVRVIGRRQIELYSRLIHTVDHVEGILREEFDALDGFLSHAWAVTVTGAPKRWAIRFIEQQERSSRRWYGGAIGRVTFDGNMNTGLTLRTIRMKDGVAEVRAGATLLYDSDPEAEEAETRLKAAAMFTAIRGAKAAPAARAATADRNRQGPAGAVDRSRRFVCSHIGQLHPHDRRRGRDDAPRSGPRRAAGWGWARSGRAVAGTGPALATSRWPRPSILRSSAICLCSASASVCKASSSISAARSRCSTRRCTASRRRSACRGGRLLCGLPSEFVVGRYHSLHAVRSTLPPELSVTAETADGVVMAIEHQHLPITAVQFHPELVMTLREEIGMPIIASVMAALPLNLHAREGGKPGAPPTTRR